MFVQVVQRIDGSFSAFAAVDEKNLQQISQQKRTEILFQRGTYEYFFSSRHQNGTVHPYEGPVIL